MNVTLTKFALRSKALDERVRVNEGWHPQDPVPLIRGTNRLLAYFGVAFVVAVACIVWRAWS